MSDSFPDIRSVAVIINGIFNSSNVLHEIRFLVAFESLSFLIIDLRVAPTIKTY